MKKGRNLSIVLADIMGGKTPPGLAAVLAAKPGKTPREAVKELLEQVEGRRKLLDARDDSYGRCGVCGDDLGLPALEQMPWADRCRAHAAV